MAKSAQLLEKIDWPSFGPAPLVGVDEVGRGCLAGPVVAGAVCLISDQGLSALTDSKLLSESQREAQAAVIREHHLFGIGFASVEEIERINILHASLLAMQRAVRELEKKMQRAAGHLLIDGTFRIPGLGSVQSTFVQGDLRVAPISAASIVAKVHRDRWMRDIAREFPVYGFEDHKGYASPRHKKAIAEHGPSPWHRKTFRGVREFLPVAASEPLLSRS